MAGDTQTAKTELTPVLKCGPIDTIPVWNKAAVLKNLGDDQDLLNDMIDLFLAEAQTQLSDLRFAQAQGDLPALADAAHAVKGSGSYFCAESMMACADRLEQAARSKEVADYGQMTEQLANSVTQLLENVRLN